MKPIDTKATDSSQPSEDSPTSSAQVPTTCSSDQTQNANKKKASDSNSIQESRSNPEISPHDVLFGRGGGTNRHTGNIHFRDLVSSKQPAYVQARKMDKTLIAKSIVAHVRGKNGRFLKMHFQLSVVNSLPLCDGLITRSRLKDGELSILDFFGVCDRVLPIVKKNGLIDRN